MGGSVADRDRIYGADENERIRRVYARSAPSFDRQARFWEKVLFQDGRRWACLQVRGEVLDVGIGTGLNLPLYPDDVRLTGIELCPEMLEIARRRAAELGRQVELRVGDAHALEFPAERFDCVVFTLSLCTIPDDRKAISEARRVLRPGGRLVLLEHVRSPLLPVRIVQRALEPLALWLGADHLLREPLEHVRSEGFEVLSIERSKWGIMERLLATKPR